MCGGGVGFGNRWQNGCPFGRLKRCWGFPAGGDRGAERAAAADQGRADADRREKHGARGEGGPCRAQAWRHVLAGLRLAQKLRPGQLIMPESIAALSVFAELLVENPPAEMSPAGGAPDLEIVVGDVVIRAGADADEGRLTRAIRAARASAP